MYPALWAGYIMEKIRESLDWLECIYRVDFYKSFLCGAGERLGVVRGLAA